jgi:hypothetical protein
MKSKELIAAKILETKLVITKKKKRWKFANVEANQEEARNETKLEEMKINVKKSKAMMHLQAWRLITKPDSLCARFLRAICHFSSINAQLRVWHCK